MFNAIKDEDSRLRQAAIQALGKLLEKLEDTDQKRDEAFKALIVAVQDQDSSVRQAAIQALGKLLEELEDTDQKRDEAFRALIAAVQDQDHNIRKKAVRALGNFFEKLKDTDQQYSAVVATLLEVVKNGDSSIRLTAVYALSNLKFTLAALRAFLDASKDQDEDVRFGVHHTLRKLQIDIAFLPVLLDALKGTDPNACLAAVLALQNLETIDQETLIALLKAQESPNQLVFHAAFKALWGIKARDPNFIKVLCQMTTESKEYRNRKEGVQFIGTLEKLGDLDLESFTILFHSLNDTNEHVRQAAIEVLGNIGVSHPDLVGKIVPALIATTKDPKEHVRQAAAQALRCLRAV